MTRNTNALGSPANLVRFSTALRKAAGMPGASVVAGPLNQVADMLDSTSSPTGAASGVIAAAVQVPVPMPAQAPVEVAAPGREGVVEKRRLPRVCSARFPSGEMT